MGWPCRGRVGGLVQGRVSARWRWLDTDLQGPRPPWCVVVPDHVQRLRSERRGGPAGSGRRWGHSGGREEPVVDHSNGPWSLSWGRRE